MIGRRLARVADSHDDVRTVKKGPGSRERWKNKEGGFTAGESTLPVKRHCCPVKLTQENSS